MSNPKDDLVPAKRKLIDIKLSSAGHATKEIITDPFEPPTFGLCDLTHLSLRVGLYDSLRRVFLIPISHPTTGDGASALLFRNVGDEGFSGEHERRD